MSPLLWLGRMPQRLATPSTVVVASGDSCMAGPPLLRQRFRKEEHWPRQKKTPRSPFEPRGVFFAYAPFFASHCWEAFLWSVAQSTTIPPVFG